MKILKVIPATLYEKIDSSYGRDLQKLEENLTAAEKELLKCNNYSRDYKKHKKLLNEFSGKYMMPREMWNKYFEFLHTTSYGTQKNAISLSLYHFYYDPAKMNVNNNKTFPKLFKRKIIDELEPGNSGTIIIEDLCYPNKYLNVKRREYEKENLFIISKKLIHTIKEMKKLYIKIKAVEEDEEKWIAELKESNKIMNANDDKFVQHNIEYKLGKDLTNKKLWKLYIEDLKQHDKVTLLQTYSKYCRFFTDDSEMKKEYSNAAKENDGQVSVLWKNPFKWEKHVEYFEKIKENSGRKRKHSPIKQRKINLHVNSQDVLPQKFSFRSTLIDYILTHANFYLLNNLFQSCKWFYIRNPVSLCHRLELGCLRNDCKIVGQTIIATDFTYLNDIKNIYVTSILNIYDIEQQTLSHFFTKLYLCEARYILLRQLAISAVEIKILLNNGTVVELELTKLEVKNADESPLFLEDILKMTPKIEVFNGRPVSISAKTTQILAELPFESKIEHFEFDYFDDDYFRALENQEITWDDALDVKEFFEFVKKNFAEHSNLYLPFDPSKIQDMINDHWKGSDKPSASFVAGLGGM